MTGNTLSQEDDQHEEGEEGAAGLEEKGKSKG